MVYRRRRYSGKRKRSYRPRRRYGRRSKKMGIKRGPGGGQRIFRYKRWFDLPDVTIAASPAAAVGSYSFSLENLEGSASPDPTGYTDFTNLYDQYKIVGIKLMMIPPINVANVISNGRFNLYSVIDRDDSANLSSYQAAMQYSTLKTTVNNRVHTRYFKPSVTEKIQDVNGTTYLNVKGPEWISTSMPLGSKANIEVAHLGVKYITDSNTSSNPFTYNVRCCFYLAFRNVS